MSDKSFKTIDELCDLLALETSAQAHENEGHQEVDAKRWLLDKVKKEKLNSRKILLKRGCIPSSVS